MVAERVLPSRRNPMLTDEDRVPPYEILVERRCLGQTELKVRPGQVGTTNATKPDNLGVLDYAHLRVPLPDDLTDSGVFHRTNRKYPDGYFLMRRSSDGFVSATGMFKATFPWAQVEDELAEKEYLKSLHEASSEEVAGNVWVHPDQALELADEYGIRQWIDALLDPEPIAHGTSANSKNIKSPPTYRQTNALNGASRSPEPSPEKKMVDGRRSTRAVRSQSPVKKTPARKIATPRKPRRGRGAASVEPESVNGDAHEVVKVEIETETRASGSFNEEDIEQTKVNIEMPTGHPDLELPRDSEGMLATAREMVRAAERMGGASTTTTRRSKRKAEEMIGEDDENLLEGPASVDPKRARTMEFELRKEKIKRRAMTGIVASLAIGALLPSIMAAFGS